jgi:hypothetical protein
MINVPAAQNRLWHYDFEEVNLSLAGGCGQSVGSCSCYLRQRAIYLMKVYSPAVP